MRTHRSRNAGFTLVELLVVIAIIAALAGVAFTLGPRMMTRAKATESIQNLRQFGPLLASYAADNSMKLPAAFGPVPQADGPAVFQLWNEVCLAQLYPETDPAAFKTVTWWKDNKTFVRNPLFKESATSRGWQPLNPGYGMNEMIAVNLALASGTVLSPTEVLSVSVPLASLADPGRTALIAPCDNYHFRYDEEELAAFESGTMKDLLANGKMPVLFVDGHIESISPAEYLERKLFLVPIVPEI